MLDEEILLPQVFLDELNLGLVSSGEVEVVDGLLVDGEVSHGGAVLGSHVGNGGSVCEVQALNSGSEELDELADDSSLSEHLDAGEHEIGGGDVLGQGSLESESDDLGQNHGDGLTKHDGLGLDSSDSPADNSEAIDHGGVRIGSNHGVIVKDAVLVEDHAGQVLQVDLMDDTGAGGHDLEVVEGLGSPLEELESFSVSVELNELVLLGGIRGSEHVSLD
mmetsp:Transcript_3556/g.6059  ORF Transcript_3556/g.6059 Transcript_3556/m.6059 type:complete len:220 (+) Transcript_3556:1031-1690(+)